jgi:hypothetical protein
MLFWRGDYDIKFLPIQNQSLSQIVTPGFKFTSFFVGDKFMNKSEWRTKEYNRKKLVCYTVSIIKQTNCNTDNRSEFYKLLHKEAYDDTAITIEVVRYDYKHDVHDISQYVVSYQILKYMLDSSKLTLNCYRDSKLALDRMSAAATTQFNLKGDSPFSVTECSLIAFLIAASRVNNNVVSLGQDFQ